MLMVLALLCPVSTVSAQGGVTWGEPTNLSNTPTGSNHPAIVVDRVGHVHVFWTEAMSGREIKLDELPDPGNTILHRRWDGEQWSNPVDILAVPGDPLADFVSVAVDRANRLHLVWTGLTSLYYSSALAEEAHSVRAWTMPQVISGESARTAWESAIAVDSLDNVHVVFATKGAQMGVFHIMLPADGSTWTAPVRVSGFLRPNEVAYKDVRLVIDASDRLHAVWSTANDNGYSQAVYYARSESMGETWELEVMLADAEVNTGFTGFPSLLAYGEDNLLLIHVDQFNKGRVERISSDGGKTWSEPRFILLEMEGVNGFSSPLLDGAGNLHLAFIMRPSANQVNGVYYAPRSGFDWSPIVPVVTEAPAGPSAHYLDAAVRLGNQIHVVWNQARGGEIWHVSGVINGVPPAPVSTIVPRPTPAQASATSPAVSLAETAAPTPKPTEMASLPGFSQPEPVPSTWAPLAAALLPVLLLLSGVVLWRLRRP